MELEQIQRRIETLEKSQEEMRILKITLDDALKEDSTYQEIDLELRELNTKKKRLKDEVWGQPTYQEAIAKIKDIKEEIKDLTDILSLELLDYKQQNDTDEIVGSDGTPRKLKINVRLQSQRGKAE